MLFRPNRLALYLLAAGSLTCGGTGPADSTGNPVAALVVISGGDLQTADVETDLAPLTAMVTDIHGNPVEGKDIVWSATSGMIRSTASRSNSQGLVQAIWTTGTLAGAHSATATFPGARSAATFSATVRPGPPAGIEIHSGDEQAWAPASRLIEPLAAKVVDRYGNGVAGSTVTWQVIAGGGSLSAGSSVTDSGGIARTYFTLGSTLGRHTALARAEPAGSAPVTFAATASSAAGATISGVVIANNPYRPLFPGSSVSGRPPMPAAALRPPPQGPSRELLIRFAAGALGVSFPGNASLTRAAAERIRPLIAARLDSPQKRALFRVTGISPMLLTARVEVPDVRDASGIRDILLTDPAIESVEMDDRFFLEEDGSSGGAPILEPMYAFQAWHYGMVDLPDAWQVATGSRSVLVAVIDDGIRFDHPAIAANLTTDGFDFVSQHAITLCDGSVVDHTGDSDTYDPDPTAPMGYLLTAARCYTPHSQGNHGLHVAGTIGAVGNDGVGVTGLNWIVRIRPVRALGTDGSGTGYDIAQAVLYAAGLPADDGQGGIVQAPSAARIINLSLAGPNATTALRDAIMLAQNQNALIVASTGNLGPGSQPLYPASFPGVFAISSVDDGGLVAGYSSRSPYVSMSAPGGASLWPDGDASGGVMSLVYDFVNNVPGYGFKRGTSMAAPHVAGAAALILSTDPSLSSDQLKARLRNFSVDLGTPGWDQEYGAGVLNVRNSLLQTYPPAPDIYVRLVDTVSGRQVAQVKAGPGGAYSMKAIPDGVYYLMAGEDFNRDGRIGVPGRRFGTLTSQKVPGPVLLRPLSISGAPGYNVTMTISHGMLATHHVLFVNGYSSVHMGPNYRNDLLLRIPRTGRHTIEAAAPKRACGFAQMGDPVLELWNAKATTLIVANDDIDAAGFDYCARVQLDLQAGDYVVRLIGKSPGEIKLEVREGN